VLRVRGIACAILGVAGFAVGFLCPQFQLPGLGAGVIFFFLAASSLSTAAHLARALAPWVNSCVHIEVWGRPLPDSSEKRFEIDSIVAFGAGLLIRVHETASGGSRSLLKIAQPRSGSLGPDRVEIPDARYVSWAGRKLPPDTETKMPALVLTRLIPPRTSDGGEAKAS
jgi:hypothetical protein